MGGAMRSRVWSSLFIRRCWHTIPCILLICNCSSSAEIQLMMIISIVVLLILSHHLVTISPTTSHLKPPTASNNNSTSPPDTQSGQISADNGQLSRGKRSVAHTWKHAGVIVQGGDNMKSLCEDQCKCANSVQSHSLPRNTSSPPRRRQQKPQHDSAYSPVNRSVVITGLQSSVECKKGVSKVMDGCGCCIVCARQQGDSCDKINPCDALKQLFCDISATNQGALKIQTGICKQKSGEPCIIEGKTFNDGEHFQLNCSLSCSCQNGQYACASLCPQEERPPSTEHCGQAKLLSIAGRCCKEWVCPHGPQHMTINDPQQIEGEYASSLGYSVPGFPGHILTGHASSVSSMRDQSKKELCVKDVSQWSSCSATCGTGWSIHITNDNEKCVTVVEHKMCYIRPCPPDEAHINPNVSLILSECHEGSSMVELSIEDCTSESQVNTTLCNNCYSPSAKFNSNRHRPQQPPQNFPLKKKRCCRSGQTKTVEVPMKCKNGTLTSMKFKEVKSCRCREKYCRE